MNKLFNRFLINFPKNTVFGWGAKIDKIDTMKVLGISYHKPFTNVIQEQSDSLY